jgi:hypothetical protein
VVAILEGEGVGMALFTNKADANRPLLTRVCQLDLSNLWEVAELVNEVWTGKRIHQQLSMFPMMILFHAGLSMPEMMNEFTPSPTPGDWEEAARDSARFYTEHLLLRLEFAQRVMENIGRHNKILGSDLKIINNHALRNIKVGFEDLIDINEYYSIDELGIYDNGDQVDFFSENLMRDIKGIVIETFSPTPTLRKRQKPIGICPECDKPFVIAGGAGGRRGDGARYCSYRCDHRAKGRERYSALFSDRKTL